MSGRSGDQADGETSGTSRESRDGESESPRPAAQDDASDFTQQTIEPDAQQHRQTDAQIFTPEPLVSFNRVSYQSPGAYTTPLLENLNFELHQGHSLVLTGPAGNGKSAAIALVMGGTRPTNGELRVLGLRPRLLPSDQLDAMRARIGYVPQHGGLLSNLSLADNISLPLRYHRSAGDAEVKDALERMQELLGIDEIPTIASALASLRLRRLAALARALILEPKLLVVDEPARDLAGMAKHEIWHLIARIQAARQLTVLACTSDAETAYLLGGQVLSLPSRHAARASIASVTGTFMGRL